MCNKRKLWHMGSIAFLASLLVVAPGSRTTQGAVTCNSSVSVCDEPTSYPIYNNTALFESGIEYTVETEDLALLPGQTSGLDTVLWVVELESFNLYGAATGTVIAVNDDCGRELRSCVTFTPASSFVGIVFVAGHTTVSGSQGYGQCDVVISENGQEEFRSDDIWFGGWSISRHTVLEDDEMFVGVPTNTAPFDWHENQMVLFENSTIDCQADCGEFRWCAGYGQCRVSGLSRLTSDSNYGQSRILVGAQLQNTFVPTRLFHSRLGSGWSGLDYGDPDYDHLTNEIEEHLGTCDSAIGPGVDCSTTFGRKLASRSGFDPADSDNDGLGDLSEVFAKRVLCAPAPVPPYNDPHTCMDVTLDWVDYSGLSTFELPVSAMDSPDPIEFDYYLEMDSLVDSTGANAFLDPFEKLWLFYVYAVEGLQCFTNSSTDSADCEYPTALDEYNRVVPHLFDDQEHVRKDNPPAWGERISRAYFNNSLTFSAHRKFTGIFHYALLTFYGGGQGGTRRLVAGSDGGMVGAYVLAHEIGHLLGLPAGAWADDRNVNRTSIMNYGFNGSFARKAQVGNSIWPSSIGDGCAVATDCGDPADWSCFQDVCHRICAADNDCDDPAACIGGVCRIDCDVENARFSRGLEPDIDENNLQETNFSRRFAATVPCYRSLIPPTPPIQTFYSVACGGGTGNCKIDWDQDGAFEAGTVTKNIDEEGTVLTVHSDANLWARIYDTAKGDLSHMFEPHFIVLGSNMNTNASGDPEEWSGCFTNMRSMNGVQYLPGGGALWPYGDSAVFGGPGTTDGIQIDPNECLSSMTSTIDGIAPEGLRLDLLLRANSDPATQGASYYQIYHSNYIEIRLYARTMQLQAWLYISHSPTTVAVPLTAPMAIVVNDWYKLSVLWDIDSSMFRFIVIPSDPIQVGEWDGANADCVCNTHASQGNEYLPEVSFLGHNPSSSTLTFDGSVDELVLTNYTTRRPELMQVSCSGACAW